jgi:hypothetical protein
MLRVGDDRRDPQPGFWQTWVIGFRITGVMLLVLGLAMFTRAITAVFPYTVVVVLPVEFFFHRDDPEDYFTFVALFGAVAWGIYFVGKTRENLIKTIVACSHQRTFDP